LEAVSTTAQWTAAARALESERPDRIFEDPWARTVAADTGFPLLERYAGAGTAPFVVVRTKFIDEAIADGVGTRGLRQVAMIAAGMDSRAARLPWPSGTVLYELDRPGLLDTKRELLPSGRFIPRCERRTVPVDLGADWLPAAEAAGLDPTLPTLWIAEGLFFFLPESVVVKVLTTLREASAPGSLLIGDFVSASALTNPMAQGFLKMLADDGSAWLFGTDEPEAFLEKTGWHARTMKQPGEEGANFGRWTFAVPPREMVSAPRSFLFIAEVA
jgi:methyltransferase (TIGR00027 family)